MRTIIDHLEDYAETIEEAKYLKNLANKLKNTPKDELKNKILKYAPFELLTAGWGKYQDKREKKKEKRDAAPPQKEDFIWEKLHEGYNESAKQIFYLIYKKENS